MALVTFGEGYHNYHHEFQYDYRNGVKPWQFDPTKWIIWTLSKLGMAAKLRRVPTEKIVLSELNEAQRRLATKLADPGLTEMAVTYVTTPINVWRRWLNNGPSRKAQQLEVTREMLIELRREIRVATSVLRLPVIRSGQLA